MSDPEVLYRRLTSGEAGAIRERGQLLRGIAISVDAAADDVHDAAGIPVWTGDGAAAFEMRTTAVVQAAVSGQLLLGIGRDVLDHVATAYDQTCAAALESIGWWRERDADLPPILERLLAALVCAQLLGVARAYDAQLAAATAVLTGDADDLDLDALDDDTRAWVERGLDRTEDWLADYGSSTGPLIPNTAASGDDRGLTPQGLGYDPASGMLLQTYYGEDGPAVLAVIDPATGREITEVTLAPDASDPTGAIGHAGGVTVDGDHVYVSSNGHVYTYSMDQIRGASSGTPVAPTAPPLPVSGASYTAFKDGKLYVGDFDGDRLYVYERGPGGGWEPATPPSYATPPQTQGVVVRDDGFIYSTSEGRTHGSTMVVQHGHGDYDPDHASTYDFPNMSEGIVEVDGQLVTTYESGAAQYQHAVQDFVDKLLGRDGDRSLWASPSMTMTPLSALGLSPEGGPAGAFEADPRSLDKTAQALGDPAADLRKAANSLDEVTLPAHLLGHVPAAGGFSAAVLTLVGGVADSVRTSSAGVTRLAEAVELASHHYAVTDSHAHGALHALRGHL